MARQPRGRKRKNSSDEDDQTFTNFATTDDRPKRSCNALNDVQMPLLLAPRPPDASWTPEQDPGYAPLPQGATQFEGGPERWNAVRDPELCSSEALQAWEELNVNVSRFVEYLLSYGCSWHQFSPDIQKKLTLLTPRASMYVDGSAITKRAIFSGWIWRILYDNLFSPDCEDKWAHKTWKSSAKMIASLPGPPVIPGAVYESHSLMSTWARLSYAAAGQHSDPERLTKIIAGELDLPINDPSMPPQLGVGLRGLSELAVKVDMGVLISTQRIIIEMHDPATGTISGFPFDQRWMAVELSNLGSASGSIVDLITRPLLRSFGNPGKPPLPETYYTCWDTRRMGVCTL